MSEDDRVRLHPAASTNRALTHGRKPKTFGPDGVRLPALSYHTGNNFFGCLTGGYPCAGEIESSMPL